MNIILENKRIRYIIPFSYKTNGRNLAEIIADIDEARDEFDGMFVQDSVRANEQDIYQYVLDSFAEIGRNNDKNVGAIFRYEKSSNSKDSGILDLEYRPRNAEKCLKFCISDIGLFIFEVGIGFLWYEIGAAVEPETYQDLSSEELIVFNNVFKELNYKSNLEIIKAVYFENFSMGDYIGRLLKQIDGIRYYGHRQNEITQSGSPMYVPDKAIVFSYIHVNKNRNETNPAEKKTLFNRNSQPIMIDWSKEMEEIAYYVSRCYKRSYEIPDNIASQMFKPFANAIWFVSKEGAGYYVTSDDKMNNKTFFSRGMRRKVMDDYFLIYILVLYQSYAMLLFAEEIADKLPSSAQIYTDGLNKIEEMQSDDEYRFKEIEETLSEIVTRVNVFLTKSIRASISHVGQQNDFYIYAKQQLYIKQDIDNVTEGIESLQKIVHSSRQNWENILEKRRDDKVSFTIGILSIIAFVSAIYDGLCLINEFFLAEESGGYAGSIICNVGIIKISFAFFALVFIVVIIGVGKTMFPSFEALIKMVRDKISGLLHWQKEAEYKRLQNEKQSLIDKYNKDEMTGIYNRAGKEYYSKIILAHAKKHHKDMYVCVGDLNGLKHINDTYGHEHGDKAIITAARILSSAVEGYGKAFRIGGDEFLLIAEFNRDVDSSSEIEKKLVDGMNRFNSENENLPYQVKISFGHEIRKANTGLKDLNEMIKIADQRMYQMKQELLS